MNLFLKFALGSITGCFLLRKLYTYLVVASHRRRLIREHGCLPPNRYPVWDPFFGLDLCLDIYRSYASHRLLESSSNKYAVHGNTQRLRFMNMNIITTIEPENLKTVLAWKFQDYEMGEVRREVLGPLLGKGIFTSDGHDWEHSRALLRPNFTRSQVGDFPTFERHVAHMIDAIPRNGEAVDLQELFFRLTLDSATEFLFGKSSDSLLKGADAADGFARAFNGALDGVNRRDLRGPLRDIIPDKEFDRDVKIVYDFVDMCVRDALSHVDMEKIDVEKGGRYIFLHELAKDTTDPVRLRSESLNILLAGRDTTASLLSNCWFMLARRPDVWAKLRVEVDELGGEPPTYQQLKDMKFLRWTINESLRLHPAVPTNARMAARDTVLPVGGGPDGKAPVLVTKGTAVTYNVYAMHRRSEYFGEDVEDFKPERWENLRPSWEYLPFNGGPRICIGQQLALTEASYTIVRLMQAFKSVESRDHEPWIEKLTLTVASLNGTKVSLTPAA